MSTKTRLSRKRKSGRDQSQVPPAHDITDDFQDADTVFRLPKKSRSEKSSTSSRQRGRPRKTETRVGTQPTSLTTHSVQPEVILNSQTEEEDAFSSIGDSLSSRKDDWPSLDKQNWTSEKKDRVSSKVQAAHPVNHHETPTEDEREDDSCMVLMEIEKSLCSEDEKLCPCCKIIVPCALFTEHFKVCLHKFQLLPKKGNSTESTPQPYGEEDDGEGESLKEKQQQSDDHTSVLPCPVCLKSFRSRVQRISHMKSCAHSHGMTVEQLLLATRLVEKQAEERSALGLPVVPQHSGCDGRSTGTERISKVRLSRKRTKENEDPDVAMALAISRSLAEEEALARTKTEEKLLALGLDHIVEEDRRTRPIAVLSSAPAKPSKARARGKKYSNSTLVTRSREEREQLISEKVAALLSEEEYFTTGHWTTNTILNERSNRRLAKFQDKTNSVWEATHSGSDQPQDHFYVSELSTYIQPQKIAVGGLLRHLSQVPGRLNLTTLQDTEDESGESEGEEDEATIIDGYCTQLALAGLLGSQDSFNMTADVASTEGNQGNFISVTSNNSFESGLGFWEPSRDGEPHCRGSKEINILPSSESLACLKNAKELCQSDIGNCENVSSHEVMEDHTKNAVDSTSQSTIASEKGTHLDLKESQSKNSDPRIKAQEVVDEIETSKKLTKSNSFSEYNCDIIEIFRKKGESVALEECCSKSPVHSENKELPHIDSAVVTMNHEDIITNASRDNKDARDRGMTGLDDTQIFSPVVDDISHYTEDSTSTQVFGDHDNVSSCSECSHTTVEFSEDQNLVTSSLSVETVSRSSEISSQVSQCRPTSQSQCSEENKQNDFLLKTVAQTRENYTSNKKRQGRESESENNMNKVQEKRNKDERRKDDITNNDNNTWTRSDIWEEKGNETNSEAKEMRRSEDGKGESKVTDCGRNEEPLPCRIEKHQTSSHNEFERKSHQCGSMQRNESENHCYKSKEQYGFEKSHFGSELSCESERQLVDRRTSMLDMLSEAWGGLLTQGEHSDVVVTTSEGITHSAHSLVLLARCPSLYREAVSASMHVRWEEVSQESAHVFLHYLYTGTCQVEAKDNLLFMDVFDLGLRYSCKDLIHYLEAVVKADQSVTQQSNLMASEVCGKPSESPQKNSLLLRKGSDLLRELSVSRKKAGSPFNQLVLPRKNLGSPVKTLDSPSYHSESQRKASIFPKKTTVMVKDIQELPQISDTPMKVKEVCRITELCKKKAELDKKTTEAPNKLVDLPKNTTDSSRKKTELDSPRTIPKSLKKTFDKKQNEYPGERGSHNDPLIALTQSDEETVYQATPLRKTSPCKFVIPVENVVADRGSQSPDLFDVDDDNCSFISTPQKSPALVLVNTTQRDHIPVSPQNKDVPPSPSVTTDQISPKSTVSFQVSLSNRTTPRDKRTSPSFSSVNCTQNNLYDLTRDGLHMPCKSVPPSNAGQLSLCTTVLYPAAPSDCQATLSHTNIPQKDPASLSPCEYQTPCTSVSISTTEEVSPCSTVSFHASPSKRIGPQDASSPEVFSIVGSPQRKCVSVLHQGKFKTLLKSITQDNAGSTEQDSHGSTVFTHVSLCNKTNVKRSDQQTLDMEAVESEGTTEKTESGEGARKCCISTPVVEDDSGSDTVDLTLSDEEDSSSTMEASQCHKKSESMVMACTSTFKVSDLTIDKEKGNLCPDDITSRTQSQKSLEQMEKSPEVFEKSAEGLNEPECSEIEHISSVWDDYDDVPCPVFIGCSPSPTKPKHFVESCNVRKLPSNNSSQNHSLCPKTSDVNKPPCVSSSMEDISRCKSPLHLSSPVKTSIENRKTFVLSSTRSSVNSKASQQESESPEKSRNSSVTGTHPGDSTLAEAAAELECSVVLKEFELDEELCQEQPLSQKKCGDGRGDEDVMTPHEKKGRVSTTVTPMPEYTTMTSPQLQKELEKYGIRPIGRRKAQMLLQHLYDQTHPQVTDSEADTTFSETPQHAPHPTHTAGCRRDRLQKVAKQIVKPSSTSGMSTFFERDTTAKEGKKTRGQGVIDGKRKKVQDSTEGECKRIKGSTKERKNKERDFAEEESASDRLNSSQSSTTSIESSGSECFEETLGREDQHDTSITQTQEVSLVSQVKEVITNDPELHQKVLLYQPFFIEELQATLKMNGVKFKMNALMDILDELCITFRTQAGQRIRTRRQATSKNQKRNLQPKSRRSDGNDK